MNFAEAYIADLRSRRQHLANKRPPFKASLAAQGCGRVFGEGPLTFAQDLYVREYAEYERTKLDPWKAEVAALETEIERLLSV